MNRSIKTILMPFDASGSSHIALEVAQFIAQKIKCHILFVHVSESQRKAEENVVQKLIKVVNDLKNEFNLPADFLIREGVVYKEISETAKSMKADLIIMGSHGLSGFQEFFAGSNAYKIATHAPCPVITIKEQVAHTRLEKILLPVDNSHYSRQKINYVADLAAMLQANVHVCGISGKGENELHHVEIYVKQAVDYLQERSIQTTQSVLTGKNAYKMILDEAQLTETNLIAIMTEQDIETPFMGAAAQQMIHHCPFPVLSIKPKEIGISYAAL